MHYRAEFILTILYELNHYYLSVYANFWGKNDVEKILMYNFQICYFLKLEIENLLCHMTN